MTLREMSVEVAWPIMPRHETRPNTCVNSGQIPGPWRVGAACLLALGHLTRHCDSEQMLAVGGTRWPTHPERTLDCFICGDPSSAQGIQLYAQNRTDFGFGRRTGGRGGDHNRMKIRMQGVLRVATQRNVTADHRGQDDRRRTRRPRIFRGMSLLRKLLARGREFEIHVVPATAGPGRKNCSCVAATAIKESSCGSNTPIALGVVAVITA